MNGWELTGAGVLLGLANGPACLVSCAPALAPMVLGEAARVQRRRFAWRLLRRFLCGRLAAYLLVGGLAGCAGAPLRLTADRIAPWMTLTLALALLAHGCGLMRLISLCGARCCGKQRQISPLLLGLLTGFSLCPPFLLALSWVWSQGIGPLPAALFFLAFFAGASVFLLPMGFGGYLPDTPVVGRLSRIASLLAGLVFLLRFLLAARV
jgi:sulfite exporter TauE/SafE